MSAATAPDKKDTSTTPTITAPELIDPPIALDNSGQPTNTQNQQNLSSMPEITAEEAIATPADPTKDQNLGQPTNAGNPEKISSQNVPEITPQEATATTMKPPKLDNSSKLAKTENQETLPSAVPEITEEEKPFPSDFSAQGTSEMTDKQQRSDPNGTPKTDSAFVTDPPTETSKLESTTATIPPADISSRDALCKSIEADITYIERETSQLQDYQDHLETLRSEAEEIYKNLKRLGTDDELRELLKEVTKLKLQIPAGHKGQQSGISNIRQKNIPQAVMQQMPQLHRSELLERSSEVRDFERLFDQLSVEVKICLLCFSIFPEKAIIKKRLMVYWWIAEGFVPPAPRNGETRPQIVNEKTAEEFADEYFEQLTTMGFIEPVNKNRSLSVSCYTMHPFIRFALIKITEREKFFHFDDEGMPTEKSPGTFQACLMGRGLMVVSVQDLEKLHALFNVNEPILDFSPEWFSRMKNLNILYLGSWKVSAIDHIEVEQTKFLNGLSSMEHLRFLSLQGVSTIVELPDSVSRLHSLIILDLRACYSLESIPEGIRSLKNLTYLDISECYLLEHMPRGLAALSNLKVLKGFVVGEERGRNTCSLDDLAKLEKLIKLSIYTRLSEFPSAEDLEALKHFKVLKKLTIAWGGSPLHTKSDKKQEPSEPDQGAQRKKGMPKDERKKALQKTKSFAQKFKKSDAKATSSPQLEKLEKLDLKSFPQTQTPPWLTPSSLKSLKKLYIRGGKFSDLGQYQDLDSQPEKQGPENDKWKVEILRLKYLTELEMDWRQLQELFPNLIYLEKVNCPKLSFFPSDGYGVWINKEKLKQKQVR